MATSFRYIQIVLIALVLFVPFLGQVHLFDWDEINFAECAREMIVSKDYLRMQIDFQPFYEKPPLFIWMQVLSMKLFGINEFAARFPNALAGMVTLVALFYIGKKVVNEKMAIWWVILYVATWLPHFYFKSGIIDPTFNLFIFLAFFQVYSLKFGRQKLMHMLLAGLFIGLAVLTKGPVAILVSVLSFVVYVVLNRGINGYSVGHLLGIAFIALLVTSLWFGVELLQNGPAFLREFISYQAGLFSQNIADHAEPWFYHPVVLLIGCFPASLFLFQYSRKRTVNARSEYARWMWILFWVVLILFSIVKTKIVHYSSLCYYPLTFLAALQIYRLSEKEFIVKKLVRVLLLVIGSVWGILLTAIPLVGLYKAKLIPLIKDPFAVGNLQADVHWSYAECAFGIVYLVLVWASVLIMKRHFRRGMLILSFTQVVMIQIILLQFAPKIEAYSQRAAVAFYESKQGHDVYVQVLGFHSYAHLFYAQKKPSINPGYYQAGWLINGSIDKPAYFVCKIQDADQYRANQNLKVLYEKNGFVFFERILHAAN
ncbi:MAG TPA: glycosyltransferase family 39 protein [Chitinophagaceae bacterium]|nr:glycosyltransferase family 39 protein [Chitinophagaceae bacterium]